MQTHLPHALKEHLILALIAGAIFTIDLNIPLGVAAGVPYITVILVSLLSKNQSTTFIWAIVCTLLTLTGYYLSPLGSDTWKVTSNRGLAIYAIWAVAIVSLILLERTKKMMTLTSELQLSEFRATLGQVAEYASDAVIISDANGLVIWVNKAFTDISGYTLDEVVGKKPGNLLQGKGTQLDDIRRLSEAIKQGQKIELEILNYHKNGTPYWLDLSINPIYEQGKLVRFVAVERDITKRKELEHRLVEQASQAIHTTDVKSQLITSMNQQLKEPISTLLDITKQLTLAKESHHTMVTHCYRVALALKYSVENATTLSQLDLNNLSASPSQISLTNSMDLTREAATQLALRDQIHFELINRYSPNCELVCDFAQLLPIIHFFLFDAMTQAARRELLMNVEPQRHNGIEIIEVTIQYDDNGAHYQALVNPPLSMPSNKTMGSAAAGASQTLIGTSVGAGIARQALAKFGGELLCSRLSDHQSEIRIRLPAIAKTQKSPRVTPSSNKILIAEDNRVNAMVLTKLLQSLGFHDYDLAVNGQEAVEYAKKHRYLAILMDNHMPKMTGVDATKIIISQYSPDAHIIACTADTGEETRATFFEYGARDVLYKPLDKKELARVLGPAPNQSQKNTDQEHAVGAN
ncbi:response regulator [Vibrio sp. SM6]|uniref:Response regulator n=1 Tax=Vibrio agarilyticus TaxID=2726741 RepID=A0A7X8TTB3_9VIBR|nr:response regulator [Vibrio agarilyticus]NLS14418.1 response regulator [Vibrio agarilyticus]